MKPPRLQFSLRMLLLLMAVVGIGLMIYRWPWVEEKTFRSQFTPAFEPYAKTEPYEFQVVTRTTYHRDWRGQPVKHGLLQSFRNGELWHEANYYEGQLHGPRRLWNWQGKLAIEANYRGGLMHGTYRSADPLRFTGQYNVGNWDGEWAGVINQGFAPFVPYLEIYLDENGGPDWNSQIFEVPINRPIEIITNYRQGMRHGKTTWQSLDGEVLNTAEYVDGDLVAWNGEPIVEQFRTWLHTLNDPRLVAQLSAVDGQTWNFENGNQGVRIKFDPAGDIYIHFERPVEMYLDSQGSKIAALCEFAAQQGLGFDYRYGGLWLVQRARDPSPPFVDPTGVDKIKFADGSRQQREWEERVDVDVKQFGGALQTQLWYLLEGTAITVELPEAMDLDMEIRPSPPAEHLFTRSRRDAVGYLLYKSRCRCELRGDTLVIEQRWPESHENPFIPGTWIR